jgi:hypothetical protein
MGIRMHFPVGFVSLSAVVLVIFNDVVEKRTCMSLFWGLA